VPNQMVDIGVSTIVADIEQIAERCVLWIEVDRQDIPVAASVRSSQ